MADDVNERFVQALSVTDMLNRDERTLPFGFYHPGNEEIEEGKIVWYCGADASGRILSIMNYNDPPTNDRHSNIVSYETALETRQTLIDNGWKPVKPFKSTFHTSEGDKKELNRKQRRRLARKMKHLIKQNPYRSERREDLRE